MNIIISDNWLRDFLDTPAKPSQIAKYVSLCGPSIEKIEKVEGDTLYHAEITTNRIDCVSVYGFAREVAAILPRFNIPAKLKPLIVKKDLKPVENLPFKVVSDRKLVKRTIGIVLSDIKNWQTPKWMQKRLAACGLRSLNAVVDITNYVMLEVGHPTHAFDYDKIKNKKFIVRESKKGEHVTSFDGKTYELKGGDIVFDDGEGQIIDLPGIIGTKNSVVGTDTKRVFFFIDNNDPIRIRNTSMSLAIRTVAAAINEKGVDPELAEIAIHHGIELFQDICNVKVASKIFDDYPKPYKEKSVKISKNFIDQSLGIDIQKSEIEKYLHSLEFKPQWNKDELTVKVPSFRASDINISEDLVEEIARIYGYHNIPSQLMAGTLPEPLLKSNFSKETLIKNILKSLGGIEIYTLSLVPKEFVKENALRLLNPLGKESEYLRTTLRHSLIQAVSDNKSESEPFHLFEMANIYLPNKNELPKEEMYLAGIFSGYNFRQAKGVVEALLTELNIDYNFCQEDFEGYQPSKLLIIKSGETLIGKFGVIDKSDLIYYEFKNEKLINLYKPYRPFTPTPNYPPQIEDISLILPDRTRVGDIIHSIKSTDSNIYEVILKDIFQNSYTFRVYYQNPQKTLTNDEVEIIRNKVLQLVKHKYQATLKN